MVKLLISSLLPSSDQTCLENHPYVAIFTKKGCGFSNQRGKATRGQILMSCSVCRFTQSYGHVSGAHDFLSDMNQDSASMLGKS